jgi:hypothetical protein
LHFVFKGLTWTLDGGEFSTAHPGNFAPGGKKPAPIYVEAVWASELVWKIRKAEKSLPVPVLEPVTFVP